ncbi:MAG: glycerophosphodiester phosphodiesterase [Acidimicrobiales bacterium]
MTDVLAHRGAHFNVRENTLDAFREAKELGVAGVELDVRRTSDGVLVVHHDPVVEFMTIDQTPARDLPGYVPSLDESLDVLAGLCVNVEIKNSTEEPGYDVSGSLVRDVLASIEGAADTTAIISCFDLATCEAARAQSESIDLAWLVQRSLDDALAIAHDARFTAVNPHVSLVNADVARRAVELGLALNVWTVNSPRDLSAMGRLGVARVITDEPTLALEILSSLE